MRLVITSSCTKPCSRWCASLRRPFRRSSPREDIPAGVERAEVVIVGGGIVGASIAYHLGARGVRDVVVLERDHLGSGSTTRNAGGVRLQFSTEINVVLSLRSLPRIEHFEEEMGVDPHLRQVGYLFLITEERDVIPFERSLAMWKRLDVPAQRLDAAGVHRVFPELRADDLRFATLCMRDGYCDPSSLLNGYVARAREKGVQFREEQPVTGITREGDRVTAVRTASGEIACETVVNAAGAWGAEV